MLRIESKEKIKKLLQNKKVYSYNELVKNMSISLSTIKRYCQELSNEGILYLVRGGISGIQITELTNVVKTQKNKNAKIIIAKKALKLIKDGMTIFLDAGTTTMAIASLLKNQNITIVTNNLDIISILSKKNIRTIIIEGLVRMNTMAVTGAMAAESIKKFNFSLSFIGCNALSNKKIYTTNAEEAAIKRLIINNSEIAYVVCDDTKFNTKASYIFANQNEVNVLTN